jgi:hypothetical protein
MKIILSLVLYISILLTVATLNSNGISAWTSAIWLTTYKEKSFKVDPNWELPSIEQQRQDGLNFMSIIQAADDGKLNSQDAYNELARINKEKTFHKLNLEYKLDTPEVKITGLILFLLFFYIYRRIKKQRSLD